MKSWTFGCPDNISGIRTPFRNSELHRLQLGKRSLMAAVGIVLQRVLITVFLYAFYHLSSFL